jgi:uncharacterized protein (TIGR00290 family)
VNRALIFWSSGKDSAYALHLVRSRQDVEVVGLLTTVNRLAKRVAVHQVPEALLVAQTQACELPITRVTIPNPCPNTEYEMMIGAALQRAKRAGITHVVFGDLFLEDIRAYRESLLADSGLEPWFPLWGRDTQQLAIEMVKMGLRARITCLDPNVIPRSLAGRVFDRQLLAELPQGVDPCGENGEFHTFAYAGPMFHRPIAVHAGDTHEHDGMVYADMIPG